MFSGDFTGRKATVGVTARGDGKNVFAVIVLFDSSGEWNTLVNTYDYYKDLYIRKYIVSHQRYDFESKSQRNKRRLYFGKLIL